MPNYVHPVDHKQHREGAPNLRTRRVVLQSWMTTCTDEGIQNVPFVHRFFSCKTERSCCKARLMALHAEGGHIDGPRPIDIKLGLLCCKVDHATLNAASRMLDVARQSTENPDCRAAKSAARNSARKHLTFQTDRKPLNWLLTLVI